MKRILLLLSALTVASCSNQIADSDPVVEAQMYIGLHERSDREQLTDLLGVDPVYTEWCAAFVNAVLEIDQTPNLYDIEHPYPLTARAFLEWGVPVRFDEIKPGDLVIFPRGNQGWQGHVGFYISTYKTGEWIILGGNQGNSVRYDLYNPNKALGIRRWIE
jgi:uncharacterized protein (TIGR02594 family)